jgi:phage replication O-like protein O
MGLGMANPQPDKYTKISNELLDALIRYRIPGEQMQVFLFIMRKTYGYNKKQDAIALSQFVDATGIKKANVSRAIKGLLSKKIIIIEKDNEVAHVYGIIKDYEKWKPFIKKDNVIKKDKGGYSKVIKAVIKSDNKSLSKVSTTKEIKDNITKDNIQKKVFMSDSEEIRLSKLLFDLMRINNPNCKGPNNFQGWAKSVDLMFRIDKRTSDQVEYLVRWSQQDDFWMGNILSMGTLRDKFDRLVIQAKKNPIKENGMKACSEKTLKTMRNLEAFLNEE